jgi:hypothetical protein
MTTLVSNNMTFDEEFVLDLRIELPYFDIHGQDGRYQVMRGNRLIAIVSHTGDWLDISFPEQQRDTFIHVSDPEHCAKKVAHYINSLSNLR